MAGRKKGTWEKRKIIETKKDGKSSSDSAVDTETEVKEDAGAVVKREEVNSTTLGNDNTAYWDDILSRTSITDLSWLKK